MSKAVVFEQYGDAGVLHLAEISLPVLESNEVRVRVKAAGVQPFDALFRRGGAAQWLPTRFPQQLGNDFAGVIEELGEGVTTFARNDEVLGWTMLNAYAEELVVPASQIVAKPQAMPWAEAGALSASGQTAATALKVLNVRSGDTFLVHAAAGGVGSMAVQLAKAKGATVIGTASPHNHAYLAGLGAIPVAYGDGLTARLRAAAPEGIDVALDAAGSLEALQASLAVVGDPTRIGTVAFNPAAEQLGIRRISSERSVEQLSELTQLYEQRKLRVFVQHEYGLDEAAEAHRQIETGHVRGKIALVA